MPTKQRRTLFLGVLSCLSICLFSLVGVPASQAHWADLSVAEVVVGETQTQITLTLPTGLVSFADRDHSGQLSPPEIRTHTPALENYLGQQIRLHSGAGKQGNLSVEPFENAPLPANLALSPDTHSTLLLNYTWDKPVQGLRMDYNLFLPEAPAAHCLATILSPTGSRTFVFTPGNRHLALLPGAGWLTSGELLLAIAGAFTWGAMHALSPGHGKTLVGAYLVGTRATAQHALFLGMITTITHTLGVFALGAIALFATQYVLPEKIYPWLSVLSGLMVAGIGLNLLMVRLKRSRFWSQKLPSSSGHPIHFHAHSGNQTAETGTELAQADHGHEHDHEANHSHAHNHTHPHAHPHSHSPEELHPQSTQNQNQAELESGEPNHQHNHSYEFSGGHTGHSHYHHGHGGHSHLPPEVDGSSVTWRSLLALGISGGLIPCPAAMVLLLGAIALGNAGFALSLVLAFSLGLAGVLTGLGLLLVYSKHLFRWLPTSFHPFNPISILSALCITLIGLGITAQSLLQIKL